MKHLRWLAAGSLGLYIINLNSHTARDPLELAIRYLNPGFALFQGKNCILVEPPGYKPIDAVTSQRESYEFKQELSDLYLPKKGTMEHLATISNNKSYTVPLTIKPDAFLLFYSAPGLPSGTRPGFTIIERGSNNQNQWLIGPKSERTEPKADNTYVLDPDGAIEYLFVEQGTICTAYEPYKYLLTRWVAKQAWEESAFAKKQIELSSMLELLSKAYSTK